VWSVLTSIHAKSQGNACLIGVDLQPQAQGEMPGCLVPQRYEERGNKVMKYTAKAKTRMASLSNPRHEKFSQLVANGIKPGEAYISLGYSAKGAPQSANNLLKRADVRGRVDEILQAAAASTVAEIAFDQQRVLNRLDILSRKAEDLGQISAAVRCEELIGKHRGMFIDRQVADVAISNEPSVVEILRGRRAKRLEAEAKIYDDAPAPLTGQTDVIDPEG
jgi:hypothetical protein